MANGCYQQFRTAGLIERFGAEQNMPSLLTKLRPCTKTISYSDQCRLRYWDAITDRARALALAKGGMPDTWRDRLLPPWWGTIRDICENAPR